MLALPARGILLPALGLAVLLGLSLWSIERAEDSPEQALYRTAREYLEALRAGDVETALAYLEGLSSQGEERYAAERRGWLGHLTDVRIAAGAGTGETIVAWSHPERGHGRSERLLWALDRDGRWRVRQSDLVPLGGGRRS